MTDGYEYQPAAPRKLFIDRLETARNEVRDHVNKAQNYTPTLKLLIQETKLDAEILMEEGGSEAAKGFLEEYKELEEKYGYREMTEYMEEEEAKHWLLLVEKYYMKTGLLRYDKEENWLDDELLEFYKKLERR